MFGKPTGGVMSYLRYALQVTPLAAALVSCSAPAHLAGPSLLPTVHRRRADQGGPSSWLPLPSVTRQRLAERAASLLGHSRAFEVKAAKFQGDCSGFVEAVYQAEGIPFRETVSLSEEDRGSSVAAIYRTVAALGIVFTTESPPLPGDLVFWSNTYDRDGDDENDDPLTHIGIVEHVSPGGAVTFLHRGAHGVARGRMTLAVPDLARDEAGDELNTRLRVAHRHDPPATRYLAGQLFAAFGRFDPPLLAAALDGSDQLSLDALGLGEDGQEDLEVLIRDTARAAPAEGTRERPRNVNELEPASAPPNRQGTEGELHREPGS